MRKIRKNTKNTKSTTTLKISNTHNNEQVYTTQKFKNTATKNLRELMCNLKEKLQQEKGYTLYKNSKKNLRELMCNLKEKLLTRKRVTRNTSIVPYRHRCGKKKLRFCRPVRMIARAIEVRTTHATCKHEFTPVFAYRLAYQTESHSHKDKK